MDAAPSGFLKKNWMYEFPFTLVSMIFWLSKEILLSIFSVLRNFRGVKDFFIEKLSKQFFLPLKIFIVFLFKIFFFSILPLQDFYSRGTDDVLTKKCFSSRCPQFLTENFQKKFSSKNVAVEWKFFSLKRFKNNFF